MPARTVLTREQVLEIREAYRNSDASQRELGERYGVSRTNIGAIVRRESWPHLEDDDAD